jgi:hypothetical protein
MNSTKLLRLERVALIAMVMTSVVTLTLGPTPAAHAATCSSGDTDCDRLTDGFESWLIETFKPFLVFDEEEYKCISNVYQQTATLYQVTPYRWRGNEVSEVLITVVILYPDDCGGFSHELLLGHAGDAEALRILVADDVVDANQNRWWRVKTILIKRHHDKYKRYDASQFRYIEDSPGEVPSHPVIYVSESKHAMYPSSSACEKYGPSWLPWIGRFEDCGGGPSMSPPTPPQHNVGERHSPLFNWLSDAGSGHLTRLFGNEEAWGNFAFCGGRDLVVGGCGGALGGKWWPPLKYDERDRQVRLLY